MCICCMSQQLLQYSYVVRTEEFDCGIMISASHNPYYDNGIKVIQWKRVKKLEANVEKA